MSTIATLSPSDWRTTKSGRRAVEVLTQHFLLINNSLTKTTRINLVMETNPDPKEKDLKLVISNPAQNILAPIKDWPRVTALLTASEKGINLSICPLGKDDKIALLADNIGHGWYPPVVVNVNENKTKIFSLCQNGKVWYKENKLEEIHSPIIKKITEDILFKIRVL